MSERPARLLFVAHFVKGLGHVVRSLRIASAAVAAGGCQCALLTSYSHIENLQFDPRIEFLQLPPVCMEADGQLSSTDGTAHATLLRERSSLIREMVAAWKPDVVVTDCMPLGLAGELTEMLLAAQQERWPTRFVWGIQDQASGDPGRPSTATPNPSRNPRRRAALRQYRAAFAYSDPEWINPFATMSDYTLPEELVFVGVVAGELLAMRPSPCPLIVALTGAGSGGSELFASILRAAEPLLLKEKAKLRFVVGPTGDADKIARLTAGYPSVEVWPESPANLAIQDATVVISRSGYNTAYLLAQTELPLLLVPEQSSWNHGEQWHRAQYLSRLPNIWVIDESEAEMGSTLQRHLYGALVAEPVPRALPFRTNGAANAARWLLDHAKAGTTCADS
jgi:predicted glycosyltransferase